ncbi:MAG: DNA polymerase III subunit gamma and tau [Propionibacteriaceae bacterium]
MDGPGLFDIPEEPEVLAEPAPSVSAPAHSQRPERTTPVSNPTAPLALYRRYRPDTFDGLIGQDHVTLPLRRALDNNRVNHAYLFSGPRGCGKTTSARILARCLNCEQGPTSTPCGVCQSCRDLARGGPGSIDVIEMDAASHGGVDDARDLRERAFFAPVHSRYKIYIVDEAHQVTNAGFNALLKLVEEPPPHVKFIFATTEPEKVIGTIRSRTHHYPFRLVPPKTLQNYLDTLCQAEGIAVEPAVLPLVVRAGAGSVRDSLSVLDQLLGGAAETGVSYAQATGLLGFTPDALLDEIVDAFAAGDSAGVFGSIDKVMETGQDPRRFAEDLLRRLRDLVVVAAVPDAMATGLIDVADDQAQRLTIQAQGLGLGELTRAADVIGQGITEMRGTTAPRLQLELMCARVLLPGADLDERGIHARIDRLERRLDMTPAATTSRPDMPSASVFAPPPPNPEWQRPMPNPVVEVPAAVTPEPKQQPVVATPQPVPVQQPETAVVAPPEVAASEPESAPTVAESAELPATPVAEAPPSAWIAAAEAEPTIQIRQPERQEPAPVATPEPAAVTDPAASSASPISTVELRRVWPTVLEDVKGRKRFTWIMLSQNAQVHSVEDGVLTLAFRNIGAKESWSRGGNEDFLKAALDSSLGVDLRVEAIVDENVPAAAPAPAAVAATPPQPAASVEPVGAEPQAYSYANPRPREQEPERPATLPAEQVAGLAQAARDAIKPTAVGPVARTQEPIDEPENADPSDPDVDVAVSSDQLLRTQLGATLISEEDA